MGKSRLTLFQRFPELRPALPRVTLTRLPAPVHPLERLARALGAGELWVKRDDRCGRWYGGNKPRKLEFLLGDALARGAETVITFGALGTHHGLATAICAARLGLGTVLILVDQPVRAETRANLLLCQAHGARLCHAGTPAKAALLAAWHLVRGANLRRRRFPYLIMTGGSTPRGTLGYVNAALELEEQVRAGALPEPDVIFVAVGSNGTLAGLEAGLRLTGLRTRVIGVRVSDRVPTHARPVARLANATLKLLGRHSPEIAAVPPVRAGELTIWSQYLGRGYAHPSPDSERAIALMAEHEGIGLELTYTGKTAAALIDAVAQPAFSSQCILFWNTYNSMAVAGPAPLDLGCAQLPPAFHRFFG